MTIIGRLLRWSGGVLVVALLAGWLPASLGFYGPYWQRYVSLWLANPAFPAYRWHQPLATVPGGGEAFLEVVPEAQARFRPGVLEEAASFARGFSSDSLIVMHRGELAFEQYWNTRKAHSLSGSDALAHTLAAILIGHAIADGHIGAVDQPAYHFIAEWDDERYRPITIRHLLNMASGLEPDYGFGPRSPRIARLIGTDIERANIATPVAGPPGVQFTHMGPPAQLLAIIIERATGRRYAEYLAEKLWQPIEAHDAEVLLDRPGGMAHADCCMWVAIQDWVRVGEVLRTGGLWQGRQVIPPGWVEAMVAPSAAYLNFGMMVWLGNDHEKERRHGRDPRAAVSRHSEPFAAPTFFLDGIHGQRIWVVPTKDLVIVRTGKGHPQWDDARLPNLLIRGLQP
jgi:hypothetical protein